MTGALTMNNRRENVVVDVVAGIGNNWNQGAGALSIQIPNDNGQTPLILARRSDAAINTTVATERLLDMALLDTGTIFKVGMSGVNALELEVTSFTNKVGIGKLFGKQIATTDQIPSIPSISISNSGSGNAVTSITASGHTLTVTKGSVSWNDITGKPSSFTPSAHTHNYLTVLDNRDVTMLPNNIGGSGRFQTFFNMTGMPDSQWWSGIWVNGWTDTYASWQLAGPSLYGTPPANGLYFRSGINTTWNSWKRVAFADEIPTRTSDLTNNSGFITSSALSGYTTQAWVNSQNFVKSTSTKKVTDIQPVDVLPATQASGVLYLVFG